MGTDPWRLKIARPPTSELGFEVTPGRWAVERAVAWINRCRSAEDHENPNRTAAPVFVLPAFDSCCGDLRDIVITRKLFGRQKQV